MFNTDTTLLDPWLRYLWQVSATDLHLSAGSAPRVRVDGKLVAIPEAPPTQTGELEAIINGLLDEDSHQRFHEDRQFDFAFSWAGLARFRANAFHQVDAPALALRLIPSDIPTPEQLGLPPVAASLVTRPHGLVLVTGPTGSGKSTTLAAMIGHINHHRPVHILTIEDPIEYVHQSSVALVNQREVGSDANSFEDALRAALREDPDVVLVGEMRDVESIALTLTLAETGHLVFATLHTNDAAQTVDRVIDVFPPEQQDQVRTQFSMALAGVIAQRLVPRIGGGRVAAYEILLGTPAVSNLIREGKVRQIRNIIATGQRDGMCVLEQSLAGLVQAGVISMDDAMHASVHPDDIAGLSVHSGVPRVTPSEVVLAVGGVFAAFVVGSGVNVVIDRLPRRRAESEDGGPRWETAPWAEVTAGRSRCSECGTDIRPRDNIPVLSWVLLRGRCRACGTRIEGYHPLVELLVPALAVVSCLVIGRHWPLALVLWLIPGLVAMIVIDLRTLIIPLRLLWPVFFVAVGIAVVGAAIEGEWRWLLFAAVGSAALAAPFFLLFLLMPGGMGFGDVRLAVLLGWGVGFATGVADDRLLAVVLLVALTMALGAVLGIVQGMLLLMVGRRKIPFAPALTAAAFVCMLWAPQLVDAFAR